LDDKDCSRGFDRHETAVESVQESLKDDFVTEAQAHEVISQAELLRQQEELRLLTLQNEHYKQTLDG
jgi:hypothetical protein